MARRPGLAGSLRDWRLAAALLAHTVGVSRGLYDPVRKLESARLYGDITSHAYYFVDLTVGTPPQRASVILDTGSGLLAFPCAGCPHCGKHVDPLFDVSKSSTASWIPCGGRGTAKTGPCRGSCMSGHCSYRQSYLEGSSISGYWFEDYVRLGDSIQRNPPIFAQMGCHQNENKLFYTQKANGIFGIQGSRTLLNELFADSSHVNGRVFSICLATHGGGLTVGGYNESNHRGQIQYTQQIGGGYGVKLNQVKVGDRIVKNFRSTMIDSGTTYTFFNHNQYKELRQYVEDACANDRCKASRRGECWTTRGGLEGFPVMEFYFDNNVIAKWTAREYLYGTSGSSYCYGFKDDGSRTMTTLGATWMLYKEVVFDLQRRQVGMVAAECPEYKERPNHYVDDTLPQPPPTPPPLAPTPAPTARPRPTRPPTSQPVRAPAPAGGSKALPTQPQRPLPQPPADGGTGNGTSKRETPKDAAKRAARQFKKQRRDLILKTAAVLLVVLAVVLLALACRVQAPSDQHQEHEREGIVTEEAPAPTASVVGRPETSAARGDEE